MFSIFYWTTVLDTGVHRYQVNTKTGKRRVRGSGNGGYQPTNQHWIETGEWLGNPTAPAPRSGVKRSDTSDDGAGSYYISHSATSYDRTDCSPSYSSDTSSCDSGGDGGGGD